LRIPDRIIDSVAARETVELERRERVYRGEWAGEDPTGQTVILVDDGLATGSSMQAAIAALRARGAAPTTDEEVRQLLESSLAFRAQGSAAPAGSR
jgi:predicted phosphoribosyltransferase